MKVSVKQSTAIQSGKSKTMWWIVCEGGGYANASGEKTYNPTTAELFDSAEDARTFATKKGYEILPDEPAAS